MLKLDLETPPRYRYCGERQFFKNEKHVSRFCPESVLILMRKGVLRFSEDGNEKELFPGEYYIQQAGLWQEGLKTSDLPNYFYIHFNGNFSFDGQLELRGTYNIDAVENDVKTLKNLPYEKTGMEPTRLFYNILHNLCVTEKAPSTAEILRDYVSKNYCESITLSDLSKLAFISKNQVITVFKNTFKKTPYKYLNDLRLEKACELILSTDRPIYSIALSVGFADYSVFYKAFEKRYDISPADYRAIRTKRIDLSGKITEK